MPDVHSAHPLQAATDHWDSIYTPFGPVRNDKKFDPIPTQTQAQPDSSSSTPPPPQQKSYRDAASKISPTSPKFSATGTQKKTARKSSLPSARQSSSDSQSESRYGLDTFSDHETPELPKKISAEALAKFIGTDHFFHQRREGRRSPYLGEGNEISILGWRKGDFHSRAEGLLHTRAKEGRSPFYCRVKEGNSPCLSEGRKISIQRRERSPCETPTNLAMYVASLMVAIHS